METYTAIVCKNSIGTIFSFIGALGTYTDRAFAINRVRAEAARNGHATACRAIDDHPEWNTWDQGTTLYQILGPTPLDVTD